MKVRLRNQGDTIYTLAAAERHDNLTFYRLTEISGLFLGSSLELL